jgi:copper homeostasis protein
MNVMVEDAKLLVESGADGLVFGCLDKEATVDVEACKAILKPFEGDLKVNFTFHRAFDVAQDPFKAAQVISELGFSRILTSGQVKSRPWKYHLFFDIISYHIICQKNYIISFISYR